MVRGYRGPEKEEGPAGGEVDVEDQVGEGDAEAAGVDLGHGPEAEGGAVELQQRVRGGVVVLAIPADEGDGEVHALGLGAGSPPLVEGLHGLVWEQPLEQMRSTVT